jgi:hypothetical protein
MMGLAQDVSRPFAFSAPSPLEKKKLDNKAGIRNNPLMPTKLPTKQAAKAVQIGLRTLEHWIRTGRVKAPELTIRRGHAVRLWTAADLKQLQRVKDRTFGKGRGPKKKKKA